MKLAVIKERKICFDNVVGMRNLCVHNVKKLENVMGPTPLLPTPAKDIVPKGAPISDNDSVVSSVYSQHS